MFNPKVVVGECSIQVMLKGELLMTIPHRIWEEERGIEGEEKREGVWSGELRGDHTTVLLVRYLEQKTEGCGDRSELFDRLYEVLRELKSSQWRKTLREEGIEKKERQKERKGKVGPATTAEETLRLEAGGEEESPAGIEWSKAA
jgi:hypothetical protein